jgi:hypothetical protein
VDGGQNDTPFGRKTPGRPNLGGVLTHIFLLDNGSGQVGSGRVRSTSTAVATGRRRVGEREGGVVVVVVVGREKGRERGSGCVKSG